MSDFLALYLPLVVFFLGLGAIAHARLLERPAYRGWWGEYKVNLLLRVCLSAEYRVFTHALYPGRDEAKPTQVDHVVVSRYGLFVIENRCLKGSIVVDPTEPNTWVQTIGRRKNRVRNPLVQNYAAIKAVRQAIGDLSGRLAPAGIWSMGLAAQDPEQEDAHLDGEPGGVDLPCPGAGADQGGVLGGAQAWRAGQRAERCSTGKRRKGGLRL